MCVSVCVCVCALDLVLTLPILGNVNTRSRAGVSNTGCLNIHGTHVTANNSTNNNVFFFVSDLKILHYDNY